MNRLHRRLPVIAILTILAFMVIYFLGRNPLLEEVTAKKLERYNNAHQTGIVYKRIFFTGPTTIHFDSLRVTRGKQDTLVISSLSACINCWQILKGHLRFRKIKVENGSFHFNWQNLKSQSQVYSGREVTKDSTEAFSLPDISIRLLARILKSIPATLIIDNTFLNLQSDSSTAKWKIDHLQLKKGTIQSKIVCLNREGSQPAVIRGNLNRRKWLLSLEVGPAIEGIPLQSPLAGLFHASFHYSSVKISLARSGKSNKGYTFHGSFSLGAFSLKQAGLSDKDLAFPGCAMKFDVILGNHYLELDSTSLIRAGEILIYPYMKYQSGLCDSFVFSCHVPAFSENDIYTAIPAEMFPELSYVKTKGKLSYGAKLSVDFHQPDSLHFQSNLDLNDFRFIYIDPELLKMNVPFTYTVWESGKPVRSFVVGPDNPDFCPLDQVPVILQNAVLTAEDGTFYFHHGLIKESIEYALAENIKKRKFVRGGSTISQQLVKNVYLSHEKTLSRKFEEIVLVWIIESQHLVPKNRMFEVYLNIIEWGPGVYGIKEAARFYFDKEVQQLNEQECIFLASVIPSPKKFYYRFDKEGRLSPFMISYYNDMAQKLFRKGLLASDNGDSLSALLRINGYADNYLHREFIQTDSGRYKSMQEIE